MKKNSLNRRLWLPTVLAAVVIGIVAVSVSVRTRGQIEQGRQVEQQLDSHLDRAAQWAALTEANAARALTVLASTDTALGGRIKAEMEATSARITEIQKGIEESAQRPDEKAALDKVAETRKVYVDLRKQLAAAQAGGEAIDETRMRGLRDRLQDYMNAQQAFVQTQKAQVEQFSGEVARSRMTTVQIVTGMMLGLVALLLVSTWRMSRSILQPIREAIDTTERIAGGDLTARIDTSRGDELGDLMRGLERMTASLRQLVGEVRGSAGTLKTASTEIAAGNLDLSQRTEQTASNLQDTAGSMGELTQTVHQSVEAAEEANRLAGSAATAAERGGQVVSQVVSNMQEISSSSRRIGDIIGVIDGIAFQTNILALNAAVEAARAGEQGRGFAVVASEVRNLAQRSAAAAREIKTLIQASTGTVEQGARLVEEAGQAMDELVGSVQRVSEMIGRITASAAEQNSGIQHVNHAISHLDEMTQRNAALVEESAAAADGLREEAERLDAAVQRFRIDATAAVTPAASARPRSAPPRSAPPAPAPRPAPAPVATAPAPRPAARPAPAPAPVAASHDSGSVDSWESF
ncbi:methyl-accepting chemotaxis protein [Sphaerotilus uruguayifluvii]|uniref:Methyl-accepting chemotaxis protein n=1 Tax=Sphaerotilus uruguayifluvii TaxID=2735897 RepID=A0ABX2FXE8_9BURK|nr:methyl-accepting chemotaxis protein [Leptothrix sp. C29]NRT54688.1 methyl-accepting chemotaxis protein [Leptothrix sp. C29]